MAVTRRRSQPASQPHSQSESTNTGRTLRARKAPPIHESSATSRTTERTEDVESSQSASDDDAVGSGADTRTRRSRRNTHRSSASTSSATQPARRSRRSSTKNSVGTSSPDLANAEGKNHKRPAGRSTRANILTGKRRKLSVKEKEASPENTGNIPDWRDPRIPYDAWTSIFYHAGAQGTDTGWLIHAATTCRAFLEPALAAIYYSPLIKTSTKAKRLAALLERPPTETIINYRTKVESLFIDIHIVPQGILHQMIYPLICLKELVIFTTMDHPPYRNLDKSLRWHYPADVFRALMRENGDATINHDDLPPIILRSWEWSGRFIGGYVPTVRDMAGIHQKLSFSQLTRLSFTNFQVPSLHKPQPKDGDEAAALKIYEEDGAFIDAIAAAISQLQYLRHLVFESSTAMSDRLLPLLPRDLVHLELINCWEVRSEDLALFLRTHGSKMRILTLMHNQSLNLAFLTDLAETCPNLQELRMSMSYYRHHDSLDDSDPMYDHALLPDQVPSWPTGMRVIDLEHVRDWSVETAEMFFQSLIDNAERLRDLRHLAFKTMLNIPWQVRATMRSEWGSKMEKVFLRPFDAPRNATTPQELDDPEVSQKRNRRKRSLTPSRRSGRIAAHEAEAVNQSSRAAKRRSQSQGRSFYREPDTDEDLDVSGSGEDDGIEQGAQLADEESQAPELPVQGLCRTVNILFDNQKPREVQYGMEDFLTEDEDSEEEWNSDAEEDDDAVLAF